MSEGNNPDPFALARVCFGVVGLGIAPSFMGQKGCQPGHNPPAAVTFEAASYPPRSFSPYAPTDPREKAAVEAVRAAGGSARSDGLVLVIKLPGDLPPDTLSKLTAFNTLFRLDLSGSRVTDEHLASVAGIPNVAHLDLSRTAVTDQGVAAICQLPSLHTLDLTSTPVTDDGLQYLAFLPKLSSLTLEGTAITDDGMAELARLPGLHALDLDRTAITPDGLDRLAVLPGLGLVSIEATLVPVADRVRVGKDVIELRRPFDGAPYQVTYLAEERARRAGLDAAIAQSQLSNPHNQTHTTPHRTIGRRRH